MITFVATVLPGKFLKDVLPALIPLELGILVCKDRSPGILNMRYFVFFSVLLIFRKKSLASCI